MHLSNLYKIILTTLLITNSAFINPVQANEGTEPGFALYKAGKFEQAKTYYENKISKSPNNAEAHYMLGNVLSQLKLYPEAKQQYEIALSIDPNGSIASYCQTALSRFSGSGDKHADLVNSVRSISKETNEQEQRDESECQKKIDQIYKEADQRIQRLENEMNEKIAENGQAQYTNTLTWSPGVFNSGRIRTVKTYDPAQANNVIREDYQSQIAQIREETSKKIELVKAAYLNKEKATENSALTMDKSYAEKNNDADISLTPSGTNMYVRNYTHQDKPTGYTLPLKAAPAKSLNQSNTKNQE